MFAISTACKEQKRNRPDKAGAAKVRETTTEPSLPTTHSPAAVAVEVETKSANVIPVTSLVVGEVMSKDDAYYTPHTDNPFATKFKDATTKLVSGPVDFQWLKFDLPSPSHPHTPPATPTSPEHLRWMKPLDSWLKRCHSVPSSPYASKIQTHEVRWLTETCQTVSSSRPGNLPASLFEELNCENFEEDSGDALSDTSSAADSALGTEILRSDRSVAARWFVRRKQYNVSLSRFLSRSDLMGRYVERRQATTERVYGADNELSVTPFSPSESCLSVDDSALLSPTSSYSGDSDFWRRSARWQTYEKLQSREKVQGLVKMWEMIHTRRTNTRFSVARHIIDESEVATDGETSSRRSNAVQGHGRFGFSLPNLEHKFQDLKQQWTKHQKIHGGKSLVGNMATSCLKEISENKCEQLPRPVQASGKMLSS